MNSRISAIVKRVYNKDLEAVPVGPLLPAPSVEQENVKSDLSSYQTLIGILVGLFICLLLTYEVVYYYNHFNVHSIMVSSRKADLDKEYRRRKNLSYNINHLAEKYALHEKKMFEFVLASRGSFGKINFEPKKDLLKSFLDKPLTEVVALGEQYPNLRAVQTTQILIKGIMAVEDLLAEGKDAYNSAAENFNQLRTTFPANIFGVIFGFPLAPYSGIDKGWDTNENE
ncbi:MAG: LemA family protein [Candidatus Riflebacteria bacterium]|nr:LemA family protein [Candidatus Riflebacteria bacterium]